jgi:hypothetical protein
LTSRGFTDDPFSKMSHQMPRVRPRILQVAKLAQIIGLVGHDDVVRILQALVSHLGFNPEAHRCSMRNGKVATINK